jgi:hypothetical protein
LSKRRRTKFVPGDTASKVHQTKEPEHKDDFDEWLARIICFAFSVPPQWATKVMNRATADNQSAQSEEEGLEPTKEWVKDLIDEIIAEEFASPDLELHWLDEDDGDPETVLEGRLKLGAVTLNEMRDSLGLDPFANAAADRPMVLTPTGYVPIEAGVGGEGVDTALSPAVQKYSPDQPRVPAGNADGGQWTNEADIGSSEGLQYAALDTGTRTDATPDKPGVQVAAGPGRPGYPVDLSEEEQLGGHTIAQHVGKSEDYLLSLISDEEAAEQRHGDISEGLREGSFPSLEAANKLVNSTIGQNQDTVSLVANGSLSRAELDADFPSATGYEAFAATERSTPYIRDTYGVHVVIVRDLGSTKGYLVLTAYPVNR